MTTDGALTTLFNFHFTDGEEPTTKLTFARDGNLYGTASYGGLTGNAPGASGMGAVFRITTNGDYTPLVLFQGANGFNPQAPLTLGLDGNLYGSTAEGGPGGGGTIYRIVLTPSFSGINRLPGGNLLLIGSGPPRATYRLWTTTNLPAFPTLLQSNVFDTNGAFSFLDTTVGAAGARFYRISIP